MYDPEVFEEFKVEADEMLNESEEFLLEMEKNENFEKSFNRVFRAFHSLKGAAGMFEIEDLQSFMHSIETQFETLKVKGTAGQAEIDYFLRAVDTARSMVHGEAVRFDTSQFEQNAEIELHTQEAIVPEPVAQKEEVEKRLEKKNLGNKGLVYIVDDEEFICRELRSILSEFGYTTRTFVDPNLCLGEVLKEEPDLLCTDLKMPEMTGMELLEKIRKKKISCPVIFITGFIDNKLLTEGLDLGASGFLEKPFEQHEVISLASQAVERYRARKLLNRSLSYILYQFNDLDNYLKENGKEIQRQNLKNELETILSLKKELS